MPGGIASLKPAFEDLFASNERIGDYLLTETQHFRPGDHRIPGNSFSTLDFGLRLYETESDLRWNGKNLRPTLCSAGRCVVTDLRSGFAGSMPADPSTPLWSAK
jgi:hypothetical protein